MKLPKIFRNKYIITSLIFLIYILFLDDTDIFTVYSNLKKRSELVEQNRMIKAKLTENQNALKQLDKLYFLEHYARSKKYFKSVDEDIFVIIPSDSLPQ
ncbi:MAG: hypothetical protein EBR54_05825 [Flavobacteriia bacterium]|nr:hypothetical protein [Flavobacteriia bacterium]NBX38914.1 hypothetical protein [Flavobacteriia bacterium]